MATLQQQARALGDPTRHAVFRHVADADAPVGIAELTQRFALNHNAIRQHLAKLVAAGLLVESKVATGRRGRPRHTFVLAPAVEGRWGSEGPYERLSRLLVEIIRTGSSAEAVGRAAAGRHRVVSPTGDPVDHIAAWMARHGFEPEVRRRAAGADIVLHTCPFESSAQAARETVCALHLGLAEGLADGTGVSVEELVANDPRRAECRLRIRGPQGEIPAQAGTLRLRGPHRSRTRAAPGDGT